MSTNSTARECLSDASKAPVGVTPWQYYGERTTGPCRCAPCEEDHWKFDTRAMSHDHFMASPGAFCKARQHLLADQCNGTSFASLARSPLLRGKRMLVYGDSVTLQVFLTALPWTALPMPTCRERLTTCRERLHLDIFSRSAGLLCHAVQPPRALHAQADPFLARYNPW